MCSGCYQNEVQGREKDKALRTGLEFTMTSVSWQNGGTGRTRSVQRGHEQEGTEDALLPASGEGGLTSLVPLGWEGRELPGCGDPSLHLSGGGGVHVHHLLSTGYWGARGRGGDIEPCLSRYQAPTVHQALR